MAPNPRALSRFRVKCQKNNHPVTIDLRARSSVEAKEAAYWRLSGEFAAVEILSVRKLPERQHD